jgi:hypothetical protein
MTNDTAGSSLSDADLIGRGRSIIYQAQPPTDPVLIRLQLEILREWVSRHRVVEAADWVELGAAQRLIEELGVAVD